MREFNFDEAVTKEISISQSWAQTRLIINKEIVSEGGNNESIMYDFEPGTYLVEVEYLNNRHGVDFSVGGFRPR